MPTVKQLQDAINRLQPTVRSNGNKPKIPNRLTYMIIAADPKIQREKQFLQSAAEYMKNRR